MINPLIGIGRAERNNVKTRHVMFGITSFFNITAGVLLSLPMYFIEQDRLYVAGWAALCTGCGMCGILCRAEAISWRIVCFAAILGTIGYLPLGILSGLQHFTLVGSLLLSMALGAFFLFGAFLNDAARWFWRVTLW